MHANVIYMYAEEQRLGLEPERVSAEDLVITENLVTIGNCTRSRIKLIRNSQYDSRAFVQGSSISCLLSHRSRIFPDS